MRTVLACSLFVMAIGLTAYAHHSIDAEFDSSKTITLTGRITAIEWANPHSYLFVAVTDTDGKVQEWHVQGDAPHELARLGWTRQMLADLVQSRGSLVISGILHRQNTASSLFQEAWIREIKLPDGRTLPFQRRGR